MKKILMAIVLVLFSLIMPGAIQPVIPCAGIVDVKLGKIKIKEIDKYLKAKILSFKQAQVVETKPRDLKVAPEIMTFKDLKYGSIRLGNNEKDNWFVIRKDEHNYYSEIYMDQNFDNYIGINEKVPNIDTAEEKKGNLLIHYTYTYPKSVPVMASYKNATNEMLTKKLYFYIETEYIMKKNHNDTFWVGVINASTLDGSMKFTVDRHEQTDRNNYTKVIERHQKDIKFRLIDTDSNGCYNDYGKDCILIDFNGDGKFSTDEAQPVSEYYNIKEKKQKKQLRMIILPLPAKIAVVENNQDFDITQLEPVSDQLEAAITGEPDPEKPAEDDNDKGSHEQ